MSILNATPAAQFPAEAVGALAGKLHDPVFFQKLATDWSIRPQTAQEQAQLLEMALMLRQTHDAETVKAAASGNPFLTQALDGLKAALGSQGQPTPPPSAVEAVKTAAVHALQVDPQIAESALAYAEYLAACGA